MKTIEEKIKLTGTIFAEVRDRNGKLKERREIKNLITSAGKAALAGLLLTDVAGTAFDYIAIGTGTNAANVSDTTLQTEASTNGASRVAGTGTRVTTSVTNDTAQLVASWTFSGSFAITEAGILNASSNGTLLARQVFSAINVASGDQLQITWQVQIS